MPSPTYELFREAMAARQQIVCTYNGLRREVCAVILGHTRGEEKALTYRCLALSKVSDVELRDGPWLSGGSHSASQSCVESVDFDVNPDSPYSPKHRL